MAGALKEVRSSCRSDESENREKKQNPRISSPFLATWLSHEKFWQFDWYPSEYGSKIGVQTGKKLGINCIVSDRPVLEATMILTHSVLRNVIGWACGSTRQRSNSQCDPVLAWKLPHVCPFSGGFRGLQKCDPKVWQPRVRSQASRLGSINLINSSSSISARAWSGT